MMAVYRMESLLVSAELSALSARNAWRQTVLDFFDDRASRYATGEAIAFVTGSARTFDEIADFEIESMGG